MRAEFACPECGNIISAPLTLAGASAPCPRCRATVDRWPAPLVRPSAPAPLPPDSVPALPNRIAVDHTDTARHQGHGGSAFRTMLGGSLGCLVVLLLVLGLWLYYKSPIMSDPHAMDYVTSGLPSNAKDWTNSEVHSFLTKKKIDCELNGRSGYDALKFRLKGTELPEGLFYVRRYSSPREAIRDMEDRNDGQTHFQWGVFVFTGRDATIKRIMAILGE